MIASHHFTSANVGEFGHGRKLLSGELQCSEVWVNHHTAEFLWKPLASTRLPPHFYISSDKSTPLKSQIKQLCFVQ